MATTSATATKPNSIIPKDSGELSKRLSTIFYHLNFFGYSIGKLSCE